MLFCIPEDVVIDVVPKIGVKEVGALVTEVFVDKPNCGTEPLTENQLQITNYIYIIFLLCKYL